MDSHLIVTLGRCGSGMLRSLIIQYYEQKYGYKDIWEFEFFGRQMSNYSAMISAQRRKKIEDEYNVVLADDMRMEDIYKIVQKEHFPVSKCIVGQLLIHEMMFNIFNYHNKTIVLVRKNLFELVLSYAIIVAMPDQSHVSYYTKGEENEHNKYRSCSGAVNEDIFATLCDKVYNDILLINNYKALVDNVIYYEDIQQLTPNEIMKHIGFDDADNYSFNVDTLKLTTLEEKQNMIINFNRLQEIFNTTRLSQIKF